MIMSAGLWAAFWSATKVMAAAVLFTTPLIAGLTAPKWVFLKEANWGSRRINPPEATFFRRLPAIGAVIREAAQNSLDARNPALDSSTPIRMRFAIHTGDRSLPSSKAATYLEGLSKHLEASGFDPVPQFAHGMPYLVVEDFGTLGLIGDAGPSAKRDEEDNRFYWFHRNVNRTQQNTARGGSYGYGKAAFSLASKIKSFITVSNGIDGTKRIFGNSILKSHELNGKDFGSYGDFGIYHLTDDRGEGVLPCEEQDFFEKICSDFSLQRDDSAGLSVIVPLPERNYSVAEIAESAIRNYLMPICQNRIIFEITDGTSTIEISRDSIKEISSRLMWDGEIAGAMSNSSRNQMDAMIDLALWWDAEGPGVAHQIETTTEREPNWYLDIVPEDMLPILTDKLAQGEPVAIRVDMPLKRKGQRASEKGSFTVLLSKRNDQGPSDALWFRKYISVPNRRELCSKDGYVAITIADEGCILENMLRLSEEVAHTAHEYQGVQKSFDYAQGSIRFYRKASKYLLEYLTREAPQIEDGWLSDWFPTEESQSNNTAPRRAKRRSKRKKVNEEEEEIIVSPPQPPEDLSRNHNWDVYKRPGGFSIEGSITHELDCTFRVKVAYERADGADVFKKWKKWDFDFSDDLQFLIEDSGGIVYTRIEGNEIVFTIEGPVENYWVEVTGFDVEGRDIKTKVTPRLSRRGD